jgi:hypothetical protein
MNHGHGEKGVKARGQTLLADDQAAVLALAPGKRPLSLIVWDIWFDWPSPRLAPFPYAFGNLGANPAYAQATAEGFGIIPLICCQHLEAFARSALPTRTDVQGVQQGDDLGPLVPIRGRRVRAQRHAGGIRKGMHEHGFAFPAIRDALTAAFARGNRPHPRRRTATAPFHAPQRARGGALTWPPASRRPASAAATDVRHSWRPIGGRGGDHTSGSR